MGYSVTKGHEKGLLTVDLTNLSTTSIYQTENVEDLYEVEPVPIARGKFASVKLAREQKTGEKYVLKYIRKRRRNMVKESEAKHEIAVLFLVRSDPHIIHLHKILQSKTDYIAVLEFGRGGDLQHLLDEQDHFNEWETRNIIHQVLLGLRSLHGMNIAHLDLKPQNIVMMGPLPEDGIKLVDFGLSRVIEKGMDLTQIMGTPDYVAPEVINFEPIGFYTDIWSLGVICYVLLCGHTPFGGNNDQETFVNITQGQFEFPKCFFYDASELVKSFISCQIIKRPNKRLTVHEALMHPWITESSYSTTDLNSCEIIDSQERISTYKSKSTNASKFNRPLDTKLEDNRSITGSKVFLPEVEENGYLGPLDHAQTNPLIPRNRTATNNINSSEFEPHLFTNSTRKRELIGKSLKINQNIKNKYGNGICPPQVPPVTKNRNSDISKNTRIARNGRQTEKSGLPSHSSDRHITCSMYELPTIGSQLKQKTERHPKKKALPSQLKSLVHQRMEELNQPVTNLRIFEDRCSPSLYNGESSHFSMGYPVSAKSNSHIYEPTLGKTQKSNFGSTTSLYEFSQDQPTNFSRKPSCRKKTANNYPNLLQQAVTSMSLMNLNNIEKPNRSYNSPGMRLAVSSADISRGNSIHMSLRRKKNKLNETSKYL